MPYQLTITGALAKDPEMQYLPSGTAVTSFSIPINRTWTPEGGEKQQETTWFRVAAFGKTGEFVNNYFVKGKWIQVTGRLRVDPKTGGPKTFSRQDGTVGASFEVIAEHVEFVGAKGDTDTSAQHDSDDDQDDEDDEEADEDDEEEEAPPPPKKQPFKQPMKNGASKTAPQKNGLKKKNVSDDDVPF